MISSNTNQITSIARSFDAPVAATDSPAEPTDDLPPRGLPWSIAVCLTLVTLARRMTVFGLIRALWRLAGSLFRLLVRRPVIWVLMLYLKVYGFATAVLGGRVADDEYIERVNICHGCEDQETLRPFWLDRLSAYVRSPFRPLPARFSFRLIHPIPYRASERRYCLACHCGRHLMARLGTERREWWAKNAWRKHRCEHERHPRTRYPQYITISPSGCGTRAFKVPGARARAQTDNTGDGNGRNDT